MDTITIAQVELLDKVVRVYGFRDLLDYETEVSASSIREIPDFFSKLNEYSHAIDRLYPVHEINLRRVGYKIASETLAMNVLRSMLTATFVAWESHRTRDTISVRLIKHEKRQYVEEIIKSLEKKDTVVEYHRVEITDEPYYNFRYQMYDQAIELPDWIKQDVISLRLDSYHGKYFSLCVGGQPIWQGLLTNDTNLLPPARQAIPFTTAIYHGVKVIIHDVEPDDSARDVCFTLTFNAKPATEISGRILVEAICKKHDRQMNFLNYMSGIMGLYWNCDCQPFLGRDAVPDEKTKEGRIVRAKLRFPSGSGKISLTEFFRPIRNIVASCPFKVDRVPTADGVYEYWTPPYVDMTLEFEGKEVELSFEVLDPSPQRKVSFPVPPNLDTANPSESSGL